MTATDTSELPAFMTATPDGKYEAPKPTEEQLAAVLPWVIDRTILWIRKNGYHGDIVNPALYNLVAPDKRWNGVYLVAADGLATDGRDRDGYDARGFDRNGYNKDGYNRYGYDKNGYDKDGYTEYGYNKDGYNKKGLDRYGKTREQKAIEMVKDWSPAYLAAVAAKLKARQEQAAAAAVDPEPAVADPEQQPAEELVPVAA